MSWYEYRPYVSAAQRRAQALREMSKRRAKGLPVLPVSIEGRLIARTFWGKAWCENLESYSDFENRLPRGRTYARNGSVVHLEIHKGRIEALVSGSELYDVKIEIVPLKKDHWEALKRTSAGQISSLVDLLKGKLSDAVMAQVTDRKGGLFPKPAEIKMRCSCPDYAGMCKHIAAVMYGVGNRLDAEPQLLFSLRGVDHMELITQTFTAPAAPPKRRGRALSTSDLGAIFDIELGDDSPSVPAASLPPKAAKPPAKTPARKTVPKAKPAETAQPAASTAPKPAAKPPRVKSSKTKPAADRKPAASSSSASSGTKPKARKTAGETPATPRGKSKAKPARSKKTATR